MPELSSPGKWDQLSADAIPYNYKFVQTLHLERLDETFHMSPQVRRADRVPLDVGVRYFEDFIELLRELPVIVPHHDLRLEFQILSVH